MFSLFGRRDVRRPLRTRDEAPRYTDDVAALEQLFRERPDPWDFCTDPYEQVRLTYLGTIVQRLPHTSILEIGCAEGVFTAWLTTVADSVVALDVSPTACARAQARAPKAVVLAQALGAYTPGRVFDLVVCAETLYYLSDPASALMLMRQWGTYVLVSYTRHERKRLDALVARFPVLIDEEFTYVVRRFPSKRRGCRVLVWGPSENATPMKIATACWVRLASINLLPITKRDD